MMPPSCKSHQYQMSYFVGNDFDMETGSSFTYSFRMFVMSVTNTGNGERGTGNRERESGNECTAVIRIRIQNGGRKHGKRVWEPVLSMRSSNSIVGANNMDS